MRDQPGLAKLIKGRGLPAEDTPASLPRPIGRDDVGLLSGIPLFQGLSKRHLDRIASVASTKRYTAGNPLVRAGQPATAFFVILDGRVRVEIPGHPVEFRAGDFFGEMALIDGEPRSATVVALSETYVMMIARAKFLKVLEAEPKIALAIMTTLTRRMRAMTGAATL